MIRMRAKTRQQSVRRRHAMLLGVKSALRGTRINTPCGISDFVLFFRYLPPGLIQLFPGDLLSFCLSNAMKERFEVDEFSCRTTIAIDRKISFESLFCVTHWTWLCNHLTIFPPTPCFKMQQRTRCGFVQYQK